ncbi:hypothetical protein [Hyphomicrobium sp. 1Nfss2.1]|uniref:hypothetical protein n=1 Tax=Hyphomicrobium sp. 1Nfss2.1 TaxID=3413936 RepID=UPI003C7A6EE6
MASVDFPLTADEGLDDLPRTLRREREARERAARQKEAKARAATLTHDFGIQEHAYPAEVPAGTAVTRFDVPFTHLMAFSIKAVLAAIPALMLLGAILWVAGALLKAYFPELVHMQILINFPKPA